MQLRVNKGDVPHKKLIWQSNFIELIGCWMLIGNVDGDNSGVKTLVSYYIYTHTHIYIYICTHSVCGGVPYTYCTHTKNSSSIHLLIPLLSMSCSLYFIINFLRLRYKNKLST